MKEFSLEPDEHMRWIYDYRHPDYHSEMAKDLRERRARALSQYPKWMLEQAALNDELRKLTKGGGGGEMISELKKAAKAQPVAYIDVGKRSLEWTVPVKWDAAISVAYNNIPLYER